MPIDITIIKSPENVSNAETSFTFSESGGSLGRGPDNTWVLDDPDKYMSSVHSRIGFENGRYILIDVSTNGTFLNGSSEPLGKGNKIILAEGDRFVLSDYEFIVNFRDAHFPDANKANEDLLNQPINQGPFPEANISENNDIGGATGENLFSQNDPFAAPANNYVPLPDAMPGFDTAETDPLAVLDKASSNNNQPPLQNNLFVNTLTDDSAADRGRAMNDSVEWPNSNIESGAIPDNWYDDDEPDDPATSSGHAVPSFETTLDHPPDNSFSNMEALAKLENERLSLENENKKLITDVARLKQYIKKQNASSKTGEQREKRTITAMDKTLIEALGFSEKNLDTDKVLEISETVGLLVRETMEGMMRVLSFRKKIKEEFRINVTTIQPVENNPLKFSANIDDAMENMFIKENNAYKEPIEAVREGFQGIAEHQVAVLAGMQAAFRGMLERFDPDTLEKRFEKYKKSGLIQIGKNRKNWDSYKAYHAELAGNLDNSFQYLFGYDFVQAYEEQMQRLVIARNTNTNKK
ncbi:MAG: type VI secretion system-associated FHA domain protein TagH [Gammaproteobacteria bacterium]|nr:type VI secretion system-associated FHA domain protein TagH [Gammaproteobacteria bacterium]